MNRSWASGRARKMDDSWIILMTREFYKTCESLKGLVVWIVDESWMGLVSPFLYVNEKERET